jgi:hypothetical protein
MLTSLEKKKMKRKFSSSLGAEGRLNSSKGSGQSYKEILSSRTQKCSLIPRQSG